MQEKSKLIFDYTIVLMYAFFFTGITLVGNINEHIETINNIINENTASYPFFIESPTLLILASYLKLSNIESFSLFLFLFLLIILFLIVLTSQFLGNLNYIFLFSGWLITVNWWVGYVDSILVLTTLGTLRFLILQSNNPIILVFCLIGSFSHFPIHFFIMLNIIILFKDKLNLQNFLFMIIGTTLGVFLNRAYLSSLNVGTSKRFEYVLSYETVSNSLKSLATNNIQVFYSGFSAAFLIFIFFIYFSYMQKKEVLFKIYLSIFVSLTCTGLGLDTSRIFSLVIIPVVVWVVLNLDILRNQKYFKKVLFSSFLAAFLLGPIQVFDDKIFYSSPFRDLYIYESLMPQVWYFLGL
jgi:hypothetical protein